MTLITCQNCKNLMIVADVGICTALDRVRPGAILVIFILGLVLAVEARRGSE